MKTLALQLYQHLSLRSLLLILLALSFIAASFSIDNLILEVSVATKGIPDYSFIYLVRTAMAILSSILVLSAIIQFRQTDNSPVVQAREANQVANSILSTKLKAGTISLVLLASVLFLSLFLSDPYQFYLYSEEDGFLEQTSAILLFISCGIFIYVFLHFWQHPKINNKLYLTTTALFAAGFFLLAMEEVSWFQRALEIETPVKGFEKNAQNELNLHNFYTWHAEALYYFGSFSFLILLPFIAQVTQVFQKIKPVHFFIPSPFVLFVSAVAVAYNYDGWNVIFMQLAFFITLSILVYYMLTYRKNKSLSSLSAAMFILILVTQVLYLMYGGNFVRTWDVTEYREFLMPLSFTIYAIEVLLKLRKNSDPTLKSEKL
ncbi:hypothetical protein [Pontibacter sp. SGAir0037]|uniref:hypothetical protein n=1 Tax=Pontibacter sp. SGAir0037 TaxID=2571030 RepID=UPI0010CD3C6C|nr:hypothetical protein [Pontibacter sp. SGAir0037]QCR24571.1 hypothetical protein C1N53_20900 [Pontibacter sp. SGAir0037]